FLNTPLKKCPKFVKPRLAFALGVGMEFDTYLFDGSLAPTDKEFKEQAAEIATAKMAGRTYILATGGPAEAERSCDSVYVLERGQATWFADTNEGVEHFKQLLAAEKQKRLSAEEASKRATEDDEESEGPGDLDVLASAIADEVE
ncbi:MAG: hypothetical protein ACREHV_14075, partial [Rhizomicrobium sp.]